MSDLCSREGQVVTMSNPVLGILGAAKRHKSIVKHGDIIPDVNFQSQVCTNVRTIFVSANHTIGTMLGRNDL